MLSQFLFADYELGEDVGLLPNNLLNHQMLTESFYNNVYKNRETMLLFGDTGIGKTVAASYSVVSSHNPINDDHNLGKNVLEYIRKGSYSENIIILAKSPDILQKFLNEMLIYVLAEQSKLVKAGQASATNVNYNITRMVTATVKKLESRFKTLSYNIFSKIIKYKFAQLRNEEDSIQMTEKNRKIAATIDLNNMHIICDEIQHVLMPNKPDPNGTTRQVAEDAVADIDEANVEYYSFPESVKDYMEARKIDRTPLEELLYESDMSMDPHDELPEVEEIYYRAMINASDSHKAAYPALMLCKFKYNARLIILSATPFRSNLKTMYRLSNLCTNFVKLNSTKDILSNPLYDHDTMSISQLAGPRINGIVPVQNHMQNTYNVTAPDFNPFEGNATRCGLFNNILPEIKFKELKSHLDPFYPFVIRVKSNTGITRRHIASWNGSGMKQSELEFDQNNMPTVSSYSYHPSGLPTYQGVGIRNAPSDRMMTKLRIASIVFNPNLPPGESIDPMFLFLFTSSFSDFLKNLYVRPNPKKGLYYTDFVTDGMDRIMSILSACGFETYTPGPSSYSSSSVDIPDMNITSFEEVGDSQLPELSEIEEEAFVDEVVEEEAVEEQVTKPKVELESVYDLLTKSSKAGTTAGFKIAKRDRIATGNLALAIVRNLREEYNSEANKYGDYLRAIIIGPKLSEGVDFKGVELISINPVFNFASYLQIIGRGDRVRAHNFIKNGNNPTYLDIHVIDNETTLIGGASQVTDEDGNVITEAVERDTSYENLYNMFCPDESRYNSVSYIDMMTRLKRNIETLVVGSGGRIYPIHNVTENKSYLDFFTNSVSTIDPYIEKLRETRDLDLIRDEFFPLATRYKNMNIWKTADVERDTSMHHAMIGKLIDIERPITKKLRLLAFWFLDMTVFSRKYGMERGNYSIQRRTSRLIDTLRRRQSESYWTRELLSEMAVDRKYHLKTPPTNIVSSDYTNDLYFLRTTVPIYYNNVIKNLVDILKTRPMSIKDSIIFILRIVKKRYAALNYIFSLLSPAERNSVIYSWVTGLDCYIVNIINSECIRLGSKYIGIFNSREPVSDHDITSYNSESNKLYSNRGIDTVIDILSDPIILKPTDPYKEYLTIVNSQIHKHFSRAIIGACLTIGQSIYEPFSRIAGDNIFSTLLNKVTVDTNPGFVTHRYIYSYLSNMFTIINYVRSSVIYIFVNLDGTIKEVFLPFTDKYVFRLFNKLKESAINGEKVIIISKIKSSHRKALYKVVTSPLDGYLEIDFADIKSMVNARSEAGNKKLLTYNIIIDSLNTNPFQENVNMKLNIEFKSIPKESDPNNKNMYIQWINKKNVETVFSVYYMMIRAYYNITPLDNFSSNYLIRQYVFEIRDKLKIEENQINYVIQFFHITKTRRFRILNAISREESENRLGQYIGSDTIRKLQSFNYGLSIYNNNNRVLTPVNKVRMGISDNLYRLPLNRRGILIKGIKSANLVNIYLLMLVKLQKYIDKYGSILPNSKLELLELIPRTITIDISYDTELYKYDIPIELYGDVDRVTVIDIIHNLMEEWYAKGIDFIKLSKKITVAGSIQSVAELSFMLLKLYDILEMTFNVIPRTRNMSITGIISNSSNYQNVRTSLMNRSPSILLALVEPINDNKPFAVYTLQEAKNLLANIKEDPNIIAIKYRFKFPSFRLLIIYAPQISETSFTTNHYKKGLEIIERKIPKIIDYVYGINIDMIDPYRFMIDSEDYTNQLENLKRLEFS